MSKELLTKYKVEVIKRLNKLENLTHRDVVKRLNDVQQKILNENKE